MIASCQTTPLQAAASRAMQAVASTRDASRIWGDAEEIFRNLIGHRLFTVLLCDGDSGDVVRAYSSDAAAYPSGGGKKMDETPWGDLLLRRGEPFLGRDEEAIRRMFPDHEAIIGLGLGSVMNLPMRYAGRTYGTINLLHTPGYYKDQHMRDAGIIASLLTPAGMSAPATGMNNKKDKKSL